MRLYLLLFGIVAGLWFIISSGLPAATPAAWAAEKGQPMARAVLFWSDECPHCHVVLAEVLPPLQERYGEQFQLKMLQVEIPQNWALYQQTVQLFNIQNDRFGVPTLIIGKTVLVGSQEIPDRLATEIERWLEAGGVDYPQIPGLDSALAVDMCGANECAKTEAVKKLELETCSTDTACSDMPQVTVATVLPSAPSPGPDPIANTVAGMVLASMVIVLGYAFVSTSQTAKKGRVGHTQQSQPVPAWQVWLIPVLALFGLGVAAYLAYAKLAHTAVVCGPVGDCDAVQVSSYSELFGIPVAILGALTYVAVLGMWLVAVWQQKDRNADLAWLGLFSLAFIGTLFSLYLTFLEPFVIGAVCAWCLTSAVIMTLILLISTRILVRQTLSPVNQKGAVLA